MSTEPQPVSPSELRERPGRPQKTPQLFTADQHSKYEERILSLREEVHALREAEAGLATTVEREQHKNARLQRDNDELQDTIEYRESAYEELANQYSAQNEKLEKSESEKRSLKREFDRIRRAQEETETMQFEVQKERDHWRKTIADQKETIDYQRTLIDIAEAESADYDKVADLSAANMRLATELEEMKHASQAAETSVEEDSARTRLLAQMATATRSTERETAEWLKDVQKLFPAVRDGKPDSPTEERRRLLKLILLAIESTEVEYADWLADVQAVWRDTHEVPSSAHDHLPSPVLMNKEYYETLPSIPDSPLSDELASANGEEGVAQMSELLDLAAELRPSDIEVGEEARVAHMPDLPSPTPYQRPSEEVGEGVAQMSDLLDLAPEQRPSEEVGDGVAQMSELSSPAPEPRPSDIEAEDEVEDEDDSEFEPPRGPGPDFGITRRVGGPLRYLQEGQRQRQSEISPVQVPTGSDDSSVLGPDNLDGPLKYIFQDFEATRDGKVWKQNYDPLMVLHSEDETLYPAEGSSAPHSDLVPDSRVLPQIQDQKAIGAPGESDSLPAADDTSAPDSELLHEDHVVTQIEEEDATSADEVGQTRISPSRIPSGPVAVEIIPHDILRRYRRASYTSSATSAEEPIPESILRWSSRASSISSASSSEEETHGAGFLQFGLGWSTSNVGAAQQDKAVAAAAPRKLSCELFPPWQWNWWNIICGILWALLLFHMWRWRQFWMDGNDIPDRNAIVMGYASYGGSLQWEIEKAKYRFIEYIGGHDLTYAVYGV